METHSFKWSYFVKIKFDYLYLLIKGVAVFPYPFFPLGLLRWGFARFPFFSTHLSALKGVFKAGVSSAQLIPEDSQLFLPQRMTPAAFPLHSQSVQCIPAEEIPGKRGGRNGNCNYQGDSSAVSCPELPLTDLPR